jgi:hypothetical protein
MFNIENISDADKALSATERRKEAYKRYKTKLLLKQHNIDNVEELIQMKEAERIRKYQEGYQKHLERMREQRRERGLKPKRRPFKNTETENARANMLNQIEQNDNIETEMNYRCIESLDMPSYVRS